MSHLFLFVVIMIKKNVIMKEVPEYQKFCDGCGILIQIGMACSKAKCEYCGKDLCEKCIGHEAPTFGDHREVYCKSCWSIGDKYRDKIAELEAQIESLYGEWMNDIKMETED